MTKYNLDRKIRLSDIPKIIFDKNNPLNFLQQWFPEKEIKFTNYGRSAFELILETYNIKNCKVMISAFICPLFLEIFKRRDIKPILIDVDIKTFNITPKSLKAGFDKNAKCLIVNNMNGLPCQIEDLKKILGKKQILIEDCAHCFGAIHNKKRVGSLGEAAFFSFYKNLPTISGGFALANQKMRTPKKEKVNFYTLKRIIYYLENNANLYRCFIKKRSNDNDLNFEKIEIHGPNRIVEKLISRYILDIDRITKKRKLIAKRMIKKLRTTGLEFQQDPWGEHIYTYFSFLLPKQIKRKKFTQNLQSKGIFPRIIWKIPLSYVMNSKGCKVSREISKRIVSIPLEIGYTKRDINYLVESIKKSL